MIENHSFSPQAVEWKRINMRNVAHLMGVEFIHDLYNRHEPKINSIRFRHTLTVWKDGIVNSYAPAHEWDRLGQILGDQYYRLDPELIKHTKILYARKREHFHDFIKHLKKTPLDSISTQELAALLIRFQSIVLGELYVLNFVQVEHGLTSAVKKIIREHQPDLEKAEQLFMDLIQSQRPSASQQERLALWRIIKKHRLLQSLFVYREQLAKQEVVQHYEAYKYLYSAYGENPPRFEDFWLQFLTHLRDGAVPPTKNLFPRLLSPASRKILVRLRDKKLHVLIPLLVEGGLFRDTNKALLGKSMRYRFGILDEIARREIEKREYLDFYLLAEITDLLTTSKKLDPEEIARRSKHGVTFTRFEDFSPGVQDIVQAHEPLHKMILRGQCASPGICEGVCKIVLRKEDSVHVENGDIMVAIGTDFDLIDAMYRSAAVLTEEGGILSHASVVCREINKPCCIGIKQATHLLKNNMRVRVDATRGEVTILSTE